MRRGGRALLGLLVLMSGSVAMVMAASPALGGADRPQLTITKVVEGTAPPGSEFVVDIECTGEGADPDQMTFAGPGSQTANAGTKCTATESETAGASVTYACEVTDVGANPETACGPGDNQVQFASSSAAATITITNTFPSAPAPPAEQGAAAEPVTAAARFTG
jgi:Domain of unknown function (DUF5979)